MFVEVLDRDWRVKAFHEYAPINQPAVSRRPWRLRSAERWSIRMRAVDEVASTLRAIHAPLVVVKPLVESQKAREILERIEFATCAWVFRHYRDVARSNIALFGADVNRVNLAPMLSLEPGNWRAERVAGDVRELIARHYSGDMDPVDGGALFWYARNRLFFDLGLDREARVLPLRYEDLVSTPERCLRAVYEHVGLSYPGPRVAAGIHTQSVGRGRDVSLSADIEAACSGLWDELCRCSTARFG